MALDLAGIANLDFYSPHYLESVLEKDLKGLFKAWSAAQDEKGAKLPYERLDGLANSYFQSLSQSEGERNPVRRWELARDFNVRLLEALGYSYRPEAEPLGDGSVLPLLLTLERDGNPFLWVIDAPYPLDDEEDPLAETPLVEQLPKDYQDQKLPRTDGQEDSWRQLLDNKIFRTERAPRWILCLLGTEVLLIDRHKWPQGRYLRFELSEIFRRRQNNTLKAVAGLLHKDSLAPDAGLCLHDTLDENSHKHANAVSADLKYGVRKAVELLGNEAVRYRREVQRQAVFDETVFPPEQLTSECLTYLYRLLFLFYIEAQGGELGIVPMAADVYRDGYSLETLRDLELVPLTTENARNGFFIHDSLQILFRVIDQGYPPSSENQELNLEDSYHDSMRVDPMNSPLFDADRLALLKGVRFRNLVMQQVLQLLSLSAEKKNKSRGRISYAQLGINQLGSVYESILSYTGFFAHEDLYEVAAEKDAKKLSGKAPAEREALKTYFVPASKIGDYKDTEIVRDSDGRKIVHKKGAFIFRLAGRNREKSASYYTPEVLTQCLVKYALKELLWEESEEGEKPTRKKTADEILNLTICEPAMGSSAFLIEAVDQLADAYLEARQEEVKASGGETIPPEDYQREKRRVKARLATNNCYGVDLNATAVELAKVSLWLATLFEGGKCPWFGLRLATGNSLVGARREVFKTADVTRKGTKDAPNWLGLVPDSVPLHHSPKEGDDAPPPDEVDWANWTAPPRPKGTIYHFLLPATGMAAFDKDKVIKQLAPESVKRIKEWRKEFCKPFGKKDAERLEQISDAVDRLFGQVVRERVLATKETSDRISVWGEGGYRKGSGRQADLLVRDQEEVAASLEDGSSAYRRLKLAMDAWCALWFWPIEEAGLLPDRATWIAQMELVLKGQVSYEPTYEQGNLFADLAPLPLGELAAGELISEVPVPDYKVSNERLMRLQALSDSFRERRAEYFNDCGLADISAVLDLDASLRLVQRISDRMHFHHWPLRFAEVFAGQGGFDLILGNPPWILLSFDEGGVISDFDASIATRKLSASAISSLRENQLSHPDAHKAYLEEFAVQFGSQCFLGDQLNYPLLVGMKTNLYKCFITRSWDVTGTKGVSAFLHPEGVYDDPKGGTLRAALYPRLVCHYQFTNELRLFSEVDHHVKFSINAYCAGKSTEVSATHVSNLFHPLTLDSSTEHDGHGAVPGIKDELDRWELRPHKRRIVSIDRSLLELFSSLFDEAGTPVLQARLPIVHSEEVVNVLNGFGRHSRKLGDMRGEFFSTQHWNETNAQKEGTIRRETRYPKDVSEWILQGPHFFAATPLSKTPNADCSHNLDYTSIDLASIPENYLPRTNYVPACDNVTYTSRTPKWKGRPVTDFYRHINRMFVNPVAEHTHSAAVIPPGAGLVHTALATCFSSEQSLLDFVALSQTLPYDFLVKVSGKNHVLDDILSVFPVPVLTRPLADWIRLRALVLNSLTVHYSNLWATCWNRSFCEDSFCDRDRRLRNLARTAANWTLDSPVRSDLERRTALLESDVLAAQVLGLKIDDLVAAFSIQFPVLQQYERERHYDQHGRIVPTSKTASGNPAVSLVELAATLKEQDTGFDVHAEYHPDGSNTKELRKQKICLKKRDAEVLGVSERCTMADLLAETEVRWSDEDHPEGRPVRLVGLRYTDPGLEPRMERVYPTPWTRCDREADYRQAWAEFERRLGKKMPEGSAL